MGGSSGGGGFNVAPLLNPFGNIGNKSVTNTKKQAIANIFDASGAYTNTYAALGGGEAEQKMGYTAGGEPDPIAVEPLPETPTVEDATVKAKNEAARKRRITLLSGGKTDYTSGQALGGSGSTPKSLLGS